MAHRITGKSRSMTFKAAGISLVLVVLLLSLVTVVWAHQNVTVGDYGVEYGWTSEPAVVGQPNSLVINITSAKTPTDASVDVSGLKIQALYGGQTKTLTLQPLGEKTPGQFIAPITPTRAGKYTIHLSGNIGTTPFNNDVVPEEVQPADVVQFPAPDAAPASSASVSTNPGGWLPITGLVLGALGTLLGLVALQRKPGRG